MADPEGTYRDNAGRLRDSITKKYVTDPRTQPKTQATTFQKMKFRDPTTGRFIYRSEFVERQRATRKERKATKKEQKTVRKEQKGLKEKRIKSRALQEYSIARLANGYTTETSPYENVYRKVTKINRNTGDREIELKWDMPQKQFYNILDESFKYRIRIYTTEILENDRFYTVEFVPSMRYGGLYLYMSKPRKYDDYEAFDEITRLALKITQFETNEYMDYFHFVAEPVTAAPATQALKLKNDQTVNCLLRIMADTYPKYKDKLIELGRKLREEDTETIGELQEALKNMPFKVTIKDLIDPEPMAVIKGRAYGNRNLNVIAFNGHAYPDNLAFLDVHTVEISKDLEASIANEHENTIIKFYQGDDEHKFRAYRTYCGRVVMLQKFYDDQQSRLKKYGITDYDPLVTPLALDFQHWVKINGLTRTNGAILDVVQAANLETYIWNKPSNEVTFQEWSEAIHYDRNNAYVSATYPTNRDTWKYYDQYGIPQNFNLGISDPTLEQCRNVSGIVKVSFEFMPGVHPGIRLQYIKNGYVDRSSIMHIFTPELVDLIDHKHIIVTALHTLYVANKVVKINWDEFDPYTGRILIGKCYQSNGRITYYIPDRDYRNYHYHKQLEKQIPAWIDHEAKTLSIQAPKGAMYAEVRMAILSYHRIGMFAMIRKYGDSILRAGVDDLLIKRNSTIPWTEPTHDPEDLEVLELEYGTGRDVVVYTPYPKIIGEWKIEYKTPLYAETPLECDLEFETVTSTLPVIASEKVDDVVLSVLTNQISLQLGDAGYGKSYLWYEIAVILNASILTPTKALMKKKRKEYLEAGKHIKIVNWQQYFGSSWGSPEWLANPHTKGGFSQKIIFWDEIFTVTHRDIEVFINWFKERGATVILIGDPAQLKPIDGIDNYPIVQQLTDNFLPEPTMDRRSLDDETIKFKKSLRYIKEERVMDIILDYKKMVDFEDMLEAWTPTSLVYASTNKMRAYITPFLEELHNKKFPKEPKPYMFTKTTKWKGPDDKEPEEYHNNDLVYTFKQPPNTELAYTTTIHKSIGDTVTDNVFIIADRNSSVFCQGGLYTACSRIRRMSQLNIVKIPSKMRAEAHRYTEPLEDQMERRLKGHRTQDTKKNRDNDITAEYILGLCEKTTHCPHCEHELLYTDFTRLDANVWSVNRIRDDIGHIIGNVEICCFSCNIYHRKD